MRPRFGWAVGCALLLGVLANARPAHADPLTFNSTFFLIDSSPTRLDLFSNPGVVLQPSTYDNTLPLSFLFGAFVDYPGGPTVADTIRFTYREDGADPLVYSSAFSTGTNPIRLGFSALFEPIGRSGVPVATTLT